MDATVSQNHVELARKRLQDRDQRAQRQCEDLYQQASSEAKAIIELIIRKYSPLRIYQWGSLLRPNTFRPYSDIDIATEGITDAEQFFTLLGDAQKLTRFPLDLVQLERIIPEYADDIRQKGKLIYERQ
jgi:predicted nucleotidyltransferase